MNKAREYRCRQTGKIITAAQIPDQVEITRYRPPTVKQHGKEVQPKLYFIYPPKHEKDYDQFLFDMADIDPVQPRPAPTINGFHQRVVKLPPELEDGEYVQTYKVEEIYTDLPSQVKAAVRRVEETAKQIRHGGIVVDKIPVKTDTLGIALLTGAVASKKETFQFNVGGESHPLNKAQIASMFEKVTDHIQRTYDEEARLIKEVKASKKPFEVDISALE
jgi:hypothetical protein